jgi:hypothetical protein
MMRRAHWIVVAIACAPIALGAQACSNDSPATGGNSPGQPGTTIGGDGGVAADSGKIGSDAGTDSGTVTVVDGGPAQCDPTFAWTPEGQLPGLDNATLSQFGAVSGTELALAWTTSAGDVYVADRTSTSVNFSTATKINTTAFATDRVAMSPTGNTIIAVAADRQSFVELDRSTVGGAWSVGSTNPYASINALLDETVGSSFAEPVLGADKNTFFFIAIIGTNKPFIYESRYNTTINAWAGPSSLIQLELRSTDAAHRRRPTGASADRRTLFFFDETEAVPIQRAAWRDTPDVAFSKFVDLSGLNEAAPSTHCETLYYQGAGPAVFTAD